MASTTILLPEDLHVDLKALAAREQRSLHRQIIWILQRYREAHRERPADDREQPDPERSE